jgi:hypothetical protein
MNLLATGFLLLTVVTFSIILGSFTNEEETK